MNFIPIINQKLQDILNNFKDELLSQDLSLLNLDKINDIDYNHFCSLEHLANIKNKIIGRPLNQRTVGLSGTPLHELNLKLNLSLAEWDDHKGYYIIRPGMVTERKGMFDKNALATVYPKNGYMEWHTNADVPGYNVLFTWSENGQGFFRYKDPITDEIITMQDRPGWTCKTGYFGNRLEVDKIFWHCCATDELRITIAWVFPSLEAADHFKEKIQQQ